MSREGGTHGIDAVDGQEAFRRHLALIAQQFSGPPTIPNHNSCDRLTLECHPADGRIKKDFSLTANPADNCGRSSVVER